MANVLVESDSLKSIADAIRSKNGTQNKYKPAQMAEAISDIGGGITPTGTKQISISTNGTTTEDVTAYANAEIAVNVPNSYSASDEGKVVDNGALVSQTSTNVTSNGTVDTTLINEVVVNVASSGGIEFTWNTVDVITIGANSVANTQEAKTYFSSYSYDVILLMEESTVQNQTAMITRAYPFRYRDGSVGATTYGTAYDAVLVEGTKYLLLKR